jgi:hypothetical protein
MRPQRRDRIRGRVVAAMASRMSRSSRSVNRGPGGARGRGGRHTVAVVLVGRHPRWWAGQRAGSVRLVSTDVGCLWGVRTEVVAGQAFPLVAGRRQNLHRSNAMFTCGSLLPSREVSMTGYRSSTGNNIVYWEQLSRSANVGGERVAFNARDLVAPRPKTPRKSYGACRRVAGRFSCKPPRSDLKSHTNDGLSDRV